jgi:hypothetical protein
LKSRGERDGSGVVANWLSKAVVPKQAADQRGHDCQDSLNLPVSALRTVRYIGKATCGDYCGLLFFRSSKFSCDPFPDDLRVSM